MCVCVKIGVNIKLSLVYCFMLLYFSRDGLISDFEVRVIYLLIQDSQIYIVKPCLDKIKRTKRKGEERNQVVINISSVTQSPSNRKQ